MQRWSVQSSVLAAALLGAFLCTPTADYLHSRVAAADRGGSGALGVTHIEIQDTVLQPAVERMGINLGEQTFFDSGMMLKNLVARNPGFEGGSYRSILHCVHADAARCTDDDADSAWPKDFWRGGTYEWITGPLEGRKGTVTGSTAAVRGDTGAVLQLADAGGNARTVGAAAYMVVHKSMPGDAMAGWWAQTQGGATLTTETADLSPHTAGKQALRMTAEGPGAVAQAISYFDTTEGHTFLRLHGRYRLSFRAKVDKGSSAAGKGLSVALERISTPPASFVKQNVELSGGWQDLHLDFEAKDAATAVGAVRLMFTAEQATVLLDDVSLEKMDGEVDNATVFRDEVVDALRAYRPGVLRFMQSASALGSTVGNLLAPPGARVREGYSAWSSEQTDVGYGLPEFLELCAAVHADPWIVVPAGVSAGEMRELIAYLGGANGERRGWSARFVRIHLELGNEAWNSLYKGASIEEPEAYGHRTAALFRVARQSAGFDAKKFDLIIGGQAGWHERNQQMVTHTDGADTLAVAPYLLHDIPGSATQDAVFGALLAQPEQFAAMSPPGMIAQNKMVAKSGGLGLAIYEENLHSTEGSPSQAMIDAVVPSAGAGVAMASEMLQAMRAGVKSQALFSLAGWRFHRTDGTWVPLWGTTVDMGVTNRRRPQFLAGQIINTALGGAMTATVQTGDDPVWDETAGDETAGIDGVKVQGAHMLQSFAFHDGRRRAVVLINLSRSAGLTVDFAGAVQPHGRVEMSQLRAGKISDSNEDAENVKIIPGVVPDFKAGQKVTVPGFSVMILRWSE